MALTQALKAKNITPFANGTATAWQNETIVGGLLSSMLGKEFEADIVSGKANFTDPRFVSALQAEGHQPVFLAELHRRGLSVLAAALRGRRAAMFAGGSWRWRTSRTRTRPSTSACSRLPS